MMKSVTRNIFKYKGSFPKYSFPRSLSTAQNYWEQSGGDGKWNSIPLGSLILASSLGLMGVGTASCEKGKERKGPGVQLGMPYITRAEVAKHKTLETGIWTTYMDGVYNITEFVANHPGGSDKVQLAAGGKLEPYWNLYRQHYNSPAPVEHLSRMCIGRLDPKDVESETREIDDSDPYSGDPLENPLLSYIQKKPINAEPPGPLLTHSWLTPSSVFFVRNHHPVPKIDDKNFMLEIDIPGQGVKQITLDELKSKFKMHEVIATIQCGGNRRAEMSAISGTAGTPWSVTALSNARWEGALLSDVLRYYGVRNATIRKPENEYDDLECSQDDYDKAGMAHVQFMGVDDMNASIPMSKAMKRDGDVLLAYRMNGDDIPVEHGHPVRAIVPGHAGVRSVKHVKQVQVRPDEAEGTWQRGMAYKGFNPSRTTTSGLDVSKILSLQEQPVNSAVTVPPPNHTVEAGSVLTVSGYAYSGGGRGIVRVDVSTDGGKTWLEAELTEGSEQPMHRAWGWTFWECDVEIPEISDASKGPQTLTILSKATDASYNVQPDTVDGIWNLRGINNNAWHRVTVNVIESMTDE